MEDAPKWWLPADAVLHEGDAGRKGHDGEELHFFDVRLDTQILVESLQPVSASHLKRLEDVSPEAIRDLMSGSGSGGAGVVAKPMNPVVQFLLEYFVEKILDNIDDVLAPVDWQEAAEKWKQGRQK